MAAGSVNSPVTPETTHSGGDSSRRNLGKASSSKSGENIIPHYLRTSTGSCHDFCKYGRIHAFEEKKRSSMQKKFFRKSADDQVPEKCVVVPEEKGKTSGIKLKEFPIMKATTHNTLDIIKPEVSNKSPDDQSWVENEGLEEKKQTSIVEVKPLLYRLNPLPDAPDIIKQVVSVKAPIVRRRDQDIQAAKKNSVVKPKTSCKTKAHMSDPPIPKSRTRLSDLPKLSSFKTCLSDPPKVSKSKSFFSDSPKGPTHRGSVSSDSAMSKKKDLKLSETQGSSLKLKYLPVKPLSHLDPSGGSSSRRNKDIKIGQRSGVPNISLLKVIVPPTASSLSRKLSIGRIANLNARNNRSPKVVLHLKNQNNIRKAKTKQSNNGEVQEKILYVIKMENENCHSESDKKQPCVDGSSPPPSSPSQSNSLSLASYEKECGMEYEYPTSETDGYTNSENESIVRGNREEIFEEEDKRRRAGRVNSDEEDNETVKIKFRRGKVVDCQSEINDPRRLKFRRGRMLSGNQKHLVGDACRITFKKTEFGSDTNGIKPGSEKVVLRHQDTQDKKDTQGLFNNVIEETASKLVESRKSKVKALVGAFETVISLQESKPSANFLEF